MRQRQAISMALLVAVIGGLLTLAGSNGLAQQEDVVEVSLIHSLTVPAGEVQGAPALLPQTIRVQAGETVRLFNISPDPDNILSGSPHDPVVISTDEAGENPVFDVTEVAGPKSENTGISDQGFRVPNTAVSVVEFTPDETGEFFITHRPHGHNIVGRLVVEE